MVWRMGAPTVSDKDQSLNCLLLRRAPIPVWCFSSLLWTWPWSCVWCKGWGLAGAAAPSRCPRKQRQSRSSQRRLPGQAGRHICQERHQTLTGRKASKHRRYTIYPYCLWKSLTIRISTIYLRKWPEDLWYLVVKEYCRAINAASVECKSLAELQFRWGLNCSQKDAAAWWVADSRPEHHLMSATATWHKMR